MKFIFLLGLLYFNKKRNIFLIQVEGAMVVAAGALRGASTVYMSLENAAATLAKSLTDNTVKVVTHK